MEEELEEEELEGGKKHLKRCTNSPEEESV